MIVVPDLVPSIAAATDVPYGAQSIHCREEGLTIPTMSATLDDQLEGAVVRVPEAKGQPESTGRGQKLGSAAPALPQRHPRGRQPLIGQKTLVGHVDHVRGPVERMEACDYIAVSDPP